MTSNSPSRKFSGFIVSGMRPTQIREADRKLLDIRISEIRFSEQSKSVGLRHGSHHVLPSIS